MRCLHGHEAGAHACSACWSQLASGDQGGLVLQGRAMGMHRKGMSQASGRGGWVHTGPGNKAIVVGVVMSQVLQGIAGRSAAPPATPAHEVRVHVSPSCTRKRGSACTCIT